MTLHQDKIKNPFKVQRLSLIQRSVNGERTEKRKSGKKNPQPLDMDICKKVEKDKRMKKRTKTYAGREK